MTLQRHKDLARSGPLLRSVPLTRGAALRRARLIRASTAAVVATPRRRRERGEFSSRARLLMWLRWGGLCVVCGLPLPRRGWTAQHRRARGTGGTHDPVAASVANGLAVHELPCHRLIEDHPAYAEQMGWRVPQGGDPLGTAVTDWDGRVLRLTADGGHVVLTTTGEST